jgi:hypothetical protein
MNEMFKNSILADVEFYVFNSTFASSLSEDATPAYVGTICESDRISS